MQCSTSTLACHSSTPPPSLPSPASLEPSIFILLVYTQCCTHIKPLLNMQTTALSGDKNTDSPSDQPDDEDDEEPGDNVDECSIFPGQVCSHLCVDLPRGFRCDCPTGFRLADDLRTCEILDGNGLYCTVVNSIGTICIELLKILR